MLHGHCGPRLDVLRPGSAAGPLAVRRPVGKVVYQVVDGKAVQHKVVTGQYQGDLIEIVSGITGDEKVVVDGAGFLTDGAAVREKP